MNTLLTVFSLGFILLCSYDGRKPEMPEDGVFPFIVYFESRTRGVCVGSLVSRTVVITAAVCVAGPNGELYDKRPIDVVTGTRYRHPSRGIRVQVIKILMPKLPENTDASWFVLQNSVALLLLRKRVPDLLTEQPLRAINVDYRGEDQLILQDECVVIGWHFYYAEDKLDPEKLWLLHRHMRYQHLQLVDKEEHCGELMKVYRKTADDLKHVGNFAEDDVMCFRDPNNTAQPCHGMYGAPLVCPRGRVVGMLTAPSAQWHHCDRQSNIVHKLSSRRNKEFLNCFESLLQPEYLVNWELLNKTTPAIAKKT